MRFFRFSKGLMGKLFRPFGSEDHLLKGTKWISHVSVENIAKKNNYIRVRYLNTGIIIKINSLWVPGEFSSQFSNLIREATIKIIISAHSAEIINFSTHKKKLQNQNENGLKHGENPKIIMIPTQTTTAANSTTIRKISLYGY